MRRFTRGIYPVLAAVVAVAVLFWAFVSALAAALNDSGSLAVTWLFLLILMALVLLIVLVLSVRNFVRSDGRVLAVIAIVIALAPVLIIAIFALLSNGPTPTG